jgi:hypothetical protein
MLVGNQHRGQRSQDLEELSMKSYGYAAKDKVSALVPFDFERREPGANDVVVEIAYCGSVTRTFIR